MKYTLFEMSQIIKITFLLIFMHSLKGSNASSDLLKYQKFQSSNQEISYFINYLDHLFTVFESTLNEYTITNTNSRNETDYVEKTNLQKNSTCYNHLKYTLDMARKETPWAIQMFDSIGKPTSGIMQASFSFLGLYSECIDITNNLFVGQYCLATINLWSNVQAKLGICAPSTCSVDEINSFTNKVISKLIKGSKATFSNCYQKETVNERSNGYFVSFYILLFFVILVFIATAYDYHLIIKESERIMKAQECQKVSIDTCYENCNDNSYLASSNNQIFTMTQSTDKKINLLKVKDENLWLKALLCFSAIKNSKKLFNTSEQAEDSISCLHGIKVLSMMWIIVGHSYSFGIQWLFFSNPNQFKEASQDLISQLFANGTFSVDIFFFISGLLVCTSALKLMKKSGGKLNISLFWLYRYLRIAPLMLITILFSANILRTLAEGPTWLESITMYDSWCKENWYLNVLHVHNFINREKMCLSHSWYSAVDLQFFIISPLILIPLYKKPKIGLSILFAILSVSIIVTGTLTALNDYPAIPYVNGNISLNKLNDYYGNIYIKPYCRIGPYLVGILFGYMIVKGHIKTKTSKLMHYTLTLASVSTLFAIIFSMQDANNGLIKPSITMATFYSSCARTLFSICLAYFVYCFINDKFKPLNTLLSAKIIRPFSRVSYSAYLIHPLIMAFFYGSRQQSFVFSNYLMFYFIIGHVFVTYIVSFITTIFFESPFINLSRIFLK